MPLKHSLYDTDTHFTIEPATRALKNVSMVKTAVIQHDHNSERFTFEIPRRIEGHDMSLCDLIEVHYTNIDAQTKAESKGVYVVKDMQISKDDDEIVILSWLISKNATMYVGSLNFLVRFCCLKDEDPTEVIYAWNTAMYTGISVSTGINNGEAVAEKYLDVLQEWKQTLEGEKITNIEQTKTSTASGGENIWTATFANGKQSHLSVRNGEKVVAGNSVFTASVLDGVLVIRASGDDGAAYVLLHDDETGETHQLHVANSTLYVGNEPHMTVSEINEIIGNIESALDATIAVQNELIGGVTA